MKLGCVFPEIMHADRQTDRQTHSSEYAHDNTFALTSRPSRPTNPG